MGNVALLVLVGPSSRDEARLADLLDSVARFEPDLRHCVLIDDAREQRELRWEAANCDLSVTVLPLPRRAGRWTRNSAMIAGMMTGLAWTHDIPDLDYVVKLDLDALAIGPFRHALDAFFQAHPDAGLVGCRGETCDRRHPSYLQCLDRPSPFLITQHWLETLPRDVFQDRDALIVDNGASGTLRITAAEHVALTSLLPRFRDAVGHGHSSADYCQGGAYALSGTLIRRMTASNIFDDQASWCSIPLFQEDEVFAMYSAALGLRLYDCSGEGQPFGVAWRGLAFEPQELLARKHALIHSLASDARYPEDELRVFFKQQRNGSPSRP